MEIDLIEAAAYFSALTPYISTYLIGSAYKPDLPKSMRQREYENNMNNGKFGGGYYGGGYGGGGYQGSGYHPPNYQEKIYHVDDP